MTSVIGVTYIVSFPGPLLETFNWTLRTLPSVLGKTLDTRAIGHLLRGLWLSFISFLDVRLSTIPLAMILKCWKIFTSPAVPKIVSKILTIFYISLLGGVHPSHLFMDRYHPIGRFCMGWMSLRKVSLKSTLKQRPQNLPHNCQWDDFLDIVQWDDLLGSFFRLCTL